MTAAQWERCDGCMLLKAAEAAVQEQTLSADALRQRLDISAEKAERAIVLLERHGFIARTEDAGVYECLLVRRDAKPCRKPTDTLPAWVGAIRSGLQKDGLLVEALEYAAESGEVSVSRLQRHFALGYARAGRLIDLLVESGVLEKRNRPEPCRCRISPAELKRYRNELEPSV